MPIDYSKGKIYKIVCNVSGLVYVGSTCEPILARRLAGHVTSYKQYLNGNRNYVTSFKCLENDDYDIILIENFPCESKDELYARERYYTNQIECINKIKNQGLLNELGQKEYQKQYDQKYYEANIEQKKNYYKQYYQEHKEKLNDKQKQYGQQHNEQIKQYYQDNKEKLNEKYDCDCGGCYTKQNKAQHIKTKKHQEYLAPN